MKHIDVTKTVMEKVAMYERSGIAVWLRYFIISIFGLLLTCTVVILMIIKDLLSKRTFDLFELFSQDPEIISEFWKEVLSTFWEEIPQNLLFLVICLLGIFFIMIVLTRKKRHVIRKKLMELDKYS